MSFLKAPHINEAMIQSVAASLQFNNDFVLNYDHLDFITNTLMLDNKGPTLDYDM
jgi:hypothetical protein